MKTSILKVKTKPESKPKERPTPSMESVSFLCMTCVYKGVASTLNIAHYYLLTSTGSACEEILREKDIG